MRPQREPEQKTATPDHNSAGAHHIADSPEIAPAAADDVVDLENIPVHLLGLNAIKQGAPIGHVGMSKVFKGKYGPMPVALKQAVDSVQMLINEAAIITKIQHPNVIQVFGIWKNAEQEVFMVFITLVFCLADTCVGVLNAKLIKTLQVMEFCLHGDILEYIAKPLTEVPLTTRQQWVLQVSILSLAHHTRTHIHHPDNLRSHHPCK